MNMLEGNTTLNVPELRRLLEAVQKARAAYEAHLTERRDASPEAIKADPFGVELTRVAMRADSAQFRLSFEATRALPALLDVVEAAGEYAAFDAHPHEEVIALTEVEEKGLAALSPDVTKRILAFYEAGKRLRAALAKAGPS